MDNPTTTTEPSAPKTARTTVACHAVAAPVLPARKGFRGSHAHDLGMAAPTPCNGRLTAKAVA